MNTIFQMNANELDNKFLETIKKLFKDKKLIISISEETDETTYLLQSESNAKRISEALEDIKYNKNLTKFDSIDELEKLINNEKDSIN